MSDRAVKTHTDTNKMKNRKRSLLPEKLRRRLYDPDQIDWEHLTFSSQQIWKLLIPLMVEQLLTSFMGMADTMMVSRVGSAAISAVSLTDSINVLVIQLLAALATGGTIICSQYIGHKDRKKASDAASQVLLTCTVISVAIGLVCLVFRRQILQLVFGSVEPDVMRNAVTYFLYTSLSFPFLALFQVGSAFFRAGGNSRLPMTVSVISNVLNIIGNSIFIFVCHRGVAGAALSTLLSRIFCAVVILAYLRLPRQIIVVRNYFTKPRWHLIAKVLAIGVPSGIENSMFQFGKLAIQSTVSTLGTTAIAAQAMTIILENVNGIAGIGVGIGLMTIVGQCIGAGKQEEAKYYIVRLDAISELMILLSCVFVYAIARPVVWLAGMETAAADLCVHMMGFITVVKPLVWVFSFTTAYGLRAAGDVRFSMITSSCTMWLCRVMLSVCLIRFFGCGPIAVWIGMAADWTVRGIVFTARFLSGRWLRHQVIES